MIRAVVLIGALATLVRGQIQGNCGEVITVELHKGETIYIDTPENDGSYCKGGWHIDLIRGHDDISQWRIDVEMEEMDLNCNEGSVTVTEDVDPPKKYVYCDAKNKPFYSHEHDLYLDYVIKKGKSGGARIKVSAEYLCGGRFEENNGYVVSPYYPQNYPDAVSCIYQISAPNGKVPKVTCHDFNLNTKCKNKNACGAGSGNRDYMLDMLTFESYEGNKLQGKTLKSKRFHQTLYFVSNDYKLSPTEGPYGFNCSYTFVNR